MSPNDKAVTTSARYVSEAASHLEAVKVFRQALTDAYAERSQDRARIGDLHQAIGFGLKVAEVNALLAIATADQDAPIPFTLVSTPEIVTDSCSGCIGLDHEHECAEGA